MCVLCVRPRARVCLCVCLYVCVFVCVRARACLCVWLGGWVSVLNLLESAFAEWRYPGSCRAASSNHSDASCGIILLGKKLAFN